MLAAVEKTIGYRRPSFQVNSSSCSWGKARLTFSLFFFTYFCCCFDIVVVLRILFLSFFFRVRFAAERKAAVFLAW